MAGTRHHRFRHRQAGRTEDLSGIGCGSRPGQARRSGCTVRNSRNRTPPFTPGTVQGSPTAATGRGFWILCAALILWYIAASESWRLFPPDPAVLAAATVQADAIGAVRAERIARGIAIDLEYDRNDTGLIGDSYTAMTSTQGSLPAKRSAATPEAAVLLVRLLRKAGVGPGSIVAVNSSGSFPGFALAAAAACGALQAEPVIVLSLGSSTWGANRSDFTVADMFQAALDRNVFPPDFKTTIAAVTPGGSDDRGLDLDHDALEGALARLVAHGVPVIRPASLEESVSSRMALYRHRGEPDVLLTIGGNYASTGADPELALISGVIEPSSSIHVDGTGLVQEFLRSGKPVVQVLNVENLFDRYGMTFDPHPLQPAGQGWVYRELRLPAAILLAPAVGALVLYGIGRRKKGKKEGEV
ncbi:MAG: poly-gamma-glutamate system protein [Spirochaetales bacterium]|nr:MAG: poly-gamma-glutamate system protein [Spirochaetales bacterium]